MINLSLTFLTFYERYCKSKMTKNGPKKKNLTQKNALAEMAEMAKTILKKLTAEIATFATFASANFN